MIIQFKKSCSKCGEILKPFKLWGRTMLICYKCTNPIKKKRKVYHLKMSVEERRRYQNNYQNDKNRVKREVWEGKEYTTHHKERAKVKTARKKVKQNQSKLNRFNKYYGLK